jgi:hypothetical protein
MDHAKNTTSLLEPLVLSGSAVERDRSVKDMNHSPKPNEAVWATNLHEQDAGVSAAEVGFFKTLQDRISGA